MEFLNIKSKIDMEPSKKDKMQLAFLKFFVVLCTIAVCLKILVTGFKFQNIIFILLAIYAGKRLRSSCNPNNYYEFALLDINVNDNIMNIKSSNEVYYNINLDTITSIEYSHEVTCMQIICDYSETMHGVKKDKKQEPLYLYIDYEDNQEFYNWLTNIHEVKIID